MNRELKLTVILCGGYAYSKGLPIFIVLSNVPGATFIQGSTSIPDSRVVKHITFLIDVLLPSCLFLYNLYRVILSMEQNFKYRPRSSHLYLDTACSY